MAVWHYGHFTLLSALHTQEKLFCQTVFQNGFRFTRESAPLAQPQPELSQPHLCQMHPRMATTLILAVKAKDDAWKILPLSLSPHRGFRKMCLTAHRRPIWPAYTHDVSCGPISHSTPLFPHPTVGNSRGG